MKTTQSRTLLTTTLVFLLALLMLGTALQSLVGNYLTQSVFEQLDRDSSYRNVFYSSSGRHRPAGMSCSQFLARYFRAVVIITR